jgi:hypothetical protein
MTPKISVLLPTYGRFSRLRQSLAFFLNQGYSDKEMIILNDSPEPIILDKDIPSFVKIINTPPQPNLGIIWNILKEEASGELVSIWSDDDWYLPWHLEYAQQNLTREGWKPSPCWYVQYNSKKCTLEHNLFEASLTIKKECFQPTMEYGTELYKFVVEGVNNGSITSNNMGNLTPYAFLWDDGGFHISGDKHTPESWRPNNLDFPKGRKLTPDFESAKLHYDELIEWSK